MNCLKYLAYKIIHFLNSNITTNKFSFEVFGYVNL